MTILSTPGMHDYRLLDSGEGRRLEKWGQYILNRPDPQAIWKKTQKDLWNVAHAVFENGWRKSTPIPEEWPIQYDNLTFLARLTPFKHTGIFPEQILQWEWIKNRINSPKRKISILNLFAYTGGASLACASSGTVVTHVDSSRPAILWAKQNQEVSGLLDKPIRYILEDAIGFCTREIRRGKKYDGIIMDPPVYGHGTHGEKWDFYKDFPILLDICKELLSDDPIFIVINAYAISASSVMLKNLLQDMVSTKGTIEAGELALEEQSGRLLSTGIFGRWSI